MTFSAILGTLIIVGITVVIGVVIEKKRPKLEDVPKRGVLSVPGDSPETALKKLTAQRCCERDMARNLDDHVRYGGRELLVARFTCTTCTTKRSLYVDESR
jgi:hypothetical protein